MEAPVVTAPASRHRGSLRVELQAVLVLVLVDRAFLVLCCFIDNYGLCRSSVIGHCSSFIVK